MASISAQVAFWSDWITTINTKAWNRRLAVQLYSWQEDRTLYDDVRTEIQTIVTTKLTLAEQLPAMCALMDKYVLAGPGATAGILSTTD